MFPKLKQNKGMANNLYQQIIQDTGLTDELNQIPSQNGKTLGPIIQENENKEDVDIIYPALDGGVKEFEAKLKNPQENKEFDNFPFYRTRLANPNKQGKYMQPEKSGIHVFFPPQIVRKYQNGESIENLIITEGEKKALAGAVQGLDIVAVGGIQNWRKEAKTTELHPDLDRLINALEVQNVIFLLDADCLTLEWDPDNDPNKDLAERFNNFYAAVKGFREAIKDYAKTDLYMAHILTKFEKEGKGLDDLYSAYPEQIQDINKDLLKAHPKQFFYKRNVTAENEKKLKDYFNLTRQQGNVPQYFYDRYKDVIGNRPFKFNNAWFVTYDDENLKMMKHPDADLFVRVGGDSYYKYIRKESAYTYNKNQSEREKAEWTLVPWNRGAIVDDFVKGGPRIKNFIEHIPKFDAFCNIPFHMEPFKPVIGNKLNLYYPLVHEPKAGNFDTIYGFLQHIFENEYQKKLDVALDYLQLLYTQPLQKLPILALVSRTRNTGKSTFLTLIKEIFRSNAAYITNDEFASNFNSHFISKLVGMIDEGFIPVDKRQVMEKLKNMVTNTTYTLEEKNKTPKEIDLFLKFILCSNDENNFVNVPREEVRWFVCKVPTIQNEDPDLLEKMKAEIPAFLHYLQNREMAYGKKSRLWFEEQVLITPALEKVKEESKWQSVKELEEVIKNLFEQTEIPVLYLSLDVLVDMLNENNRKYYNKTLVKKIVHEEISPTPPATEKIQRFKVPFPKNDEESGGVKIEFQKAHPMTGKPYKSRPYKFYIEDWLEEKDLANATLYANSLDKMNYLEKEDQDHIKTHVQEGERMNFIQEIGANGNNEPVFSTYEAEKEAEKN